MREDRNAPEPELRFATPADEPFLRELYRTTRIAEFSLLPLDEEQLAALCNAQFDAQAAGYRIAYPEAEHRVVWLASERAGRLVTARDDEGIIVLDLALTPEFRGRGWGTFLVRGLQQIASASSLPLRLHVEKSSPALAFYERLGFVAVGDEALRYVLRWMGP
jgi:ribosomal protein S18 acetylase RimI-like enzyme